MRAFSSAVRPNVLPLGFAAAALLAAAGCAPAPSTTVTPRMAASTVTRAPFGATTDGKQVEIFTLTNSHGIEARITNYGAIIVSLRTPDRAGNFDDITLGYDSLTGYLRDTPYFGAVVGRVGNRIARGTFTLDGVTYHLAINNGVNTLHGGLRGFDK